ncbi:unnamed protein product [Rotaria sordida]|uniref:Uncharacterized protein n=2 Tax=Rotaria sordida TaxID=392033 RepID=A0A819NLL3_9BILA|nr:unnamed protein product [Rotaria sordida]
MKRQRKIYKESLQATKYSHILNSESEESFTMILNIDGAVTKNKHVSLWPITFMINEIPLPNRRYSESIILDEAGVNFFIPGVGEQNIKFFSIASCTDKPAQSVLTNMVSHNANYSCAQCFTEGENFTVYSKTVQKSATKVFPYRNDGARNDSICNNLVIEAEQHDSPVKGHAGPCPLTKLKYYAFGESILFDSLHALYLGVFKKFCLLIFSKSKTDRQQKWLHYNKINSIDQGLSSVKIPTTTSRRFRTIKHIARFKTNEFRSLMHHGSTVLLQAMLPKYRRHFALLLAAVNITSKDVIDNYDIILVKGLLHQYVKDWQKIFDLRHMSSNIHSLLHIHKSIQYLGPLYMYSTFNFES